MHPSDWKGCSEKSVSSILLRTAPSERTSALFRALDLRGDHYIL
jgi:hypothetical protein